ncbi:MAG: hypothetical protein ACRCXZ_03185 [Patescibacteria group bacterium]
MPTKLIAMTNSDAQEKFDNLRLSKVLLEYSLRKKTLSEEEFVFWMKKIGRPNEIPWYLQTKHKKLLQ